MINKVQFFQEEIAGLIKARSLWNKLSDSIYNIAYGELENTEYSHIYTNYENTLKKIALSIVPAERTEIVEEYFEAIILEFAENKMLTFQDADGIFHIITNPVDILDAIISFDYIPSIAI